MSLLMATDLSATIGLECRLLGVAASYARPWASQWPAGDLEVGFSSPAYADAQHRPEEQFTTFEDQSRRWVHLSVFPNADIAGSIAWMSGSAMARQGLLLRSGSVAAATSG
ncbi:uncharacterized protein LOC62_07G009400 [Vanrija pseudolonga]|uniref:Uncharacterized protein n=1 Tax=Vanrija pseudolonga TaxID=143232 RepID=A0AAF0YKV0_9TREE|nr:hypothetical protein LOC62_07G009400 [Vanrija pseudolonga]